MPENKNKEPIVVKRDAFSSGTGKFNYDRALKAIEDDKRLTNFERKLLGRRIRKVQETLGDNAIQVTKGEDGKVSWNWKDGTIDGEREGGVAEKDRAEVGFGGKGFLGLKGQGYDKALDYMVLNGGVSFDDIVNPDPSNPEGGTGDGDGTNPDTENPDDDVNPEKGAGGDDGTRQEDSNKKQGSQSEDKGQVNGGVSTSSIIPGTPGNEQNGPAKGPDVVNGDVNISDTSGITYPDINTFDFNAEVIGPHALGKKVFDEWGRDFDTNQPVFYSPTEGAITRINIPNIGDTYVKYKDGHVYKFKELPKDAMDVSYLSRYNRKVADKGYKWDPVTKKQYSIKEDKIYIKDGWSVKKVPLDFYKHEQGYKDSDLDNFMNSLEPELYIRKHYAEKWESPEMKKRRKSQELRKARETMQQTAIQNPMSNVSTRPFLKKGGLIFKPKSKRKMLKSGGLIPKHSWGAALGAISSVAGAAGNIVNSGTTAETQETPGNSGLNLSQNDIMAIAQAVKELDGGGSVPKAGFGINGFALDALNDLDQATKDAQTAIGRIPGSRSVSYGSASTQATGATNKAGGGDGSTNIAKNSGLGSGNIATDGFGDGKKLKFKDFLNSVNINDIAQIALSKPLSKGPEEIPTMKAQVVSQPTVEGLSYEDEARMRDSVMKSSYIDTNSIDPNVQAAVAMSKGMQSRNISDSFNQTNAQVTSQSRQRARQVSDRNQAVQTDTDNQNRMVGYKNRVAKGQHELNKEAAKRRWVSESIQKIYDRGEIAANFAPNQARKRYKEISQELITLYNNRENIPDYNEKLAALKNEQSGLVEKIRQTEENKMTYGSLGNFLESLQFDN